MIPSKLTPEQWAEARQLYQDGETYAAIARRFAISSSTIKGRARTEGWAGAGTRGDPAAAPSAAGPSGRKRPSRPSLAAAEARRPLVRGLYRALELRIKVMEVSMRRHLQALEAGQELRVLDDQREVFTALIKCIQEVTELDTEPDRTTDGRTNTAGIRAGPEIDANGLAIASEKDALRREIAEHLEKLVPPS